MSKPQFTPGPWTPVKVPGGDYRIQYNSKGNWLGLVYHDDDQPERAKADARLIAAAPELYEALVIAQDYAQWVFQQHGEPDVGLDLKRINAALAKARGETHPSGGDRHGE